MLIPVRADKVQIGDFIVTDTFFGPVSLIDLYDLGPLPWPCFRIFIGDQGGIARFPHEIVRLVYRPGDPRTLIRVQTSKEEN